LGLVIVPVAMFLVLGAAARGAYAATITVNTTAMAFKNDKSCGLAEALVAVNNRAAFDGCPAGNGSNDTIQLQADTTYTALAGSPLSAFRPVTIQGAGGTGIDPNVGPRTIINGQALTSTRRISVQGARQQRKDDRDVQRSSPFGWRQPAGQRDLRLRQWQQFDGELAGCDRLVLDRQRRLRGRHEPQCPELVFLQQQH
jgi:hypothetical protein